MPIPGVPRSQRLLAWTFASAGASPMFTCPANHVTLVKSLSVNNQSTGTIQATLITHAAGLSGNYWLAYYNLAAAEVGHWEGFVVLNPGDEVWVYASGFPASTWLSGAVLAGAPQFPPAEAADPVVFGEDIQLLPAPS
jgi:hypothetical protein